MYYPENPSLDNGPYQCLSNCLTEDYYGGYNTTVIGRFNFKYCQICSDEYGLKYRENP